MHAHYARPDSSPYSFLPFLWSPRVSSSLPPPFFVNCALKTAALQLGVTCSRCSLFQDDTPNTHFLRAFFIPKRRSQNDNLQLEGHQNLFWNHLMPALKISVTVGAKKNCRTTSNPILMYNPVFNPETLRPVPRNRATLLRAVVCHDPLCLAE